MSRPKLDFTATQEQLVELQRLVKAPATPQNLARRARIVLLAAEARDNDEIASELKTSRVTVGLWRQRFLDFGLAGLNEAPRPGQPQARQTLVLSAHGPPCRAVEGHGAKALESQ